MYATAWLERKRATLARSTYGDYRSIWKKYVLPYFGNMPLCRVTRLDVEEFLGSLPEISMKRKNNHGPAEVSFQRCKPARIDR